MSYNRKRRVIEIYFVLYLAALILLIPQKKEDEIGGKEAQSLKVFQLPFNLKAEKNVLNTLLSFDSTGITLISADTINTIYFTGNVKNVRFDIEIEELNKNRKISLTDDKSYETKYFRIVEDLKNQNMKFYWHPIMNELKSNTYYVTITATAESNDPETLGAILKDRIKFILNYQLMYDFGDISIALEPNENGSPRIDTVLININNDNRSVLTANLFMTPAEEVLRSIAYTKWRNEVLVYGLDLNRDLRRQPVIEITHLPDKNNKGTAKIVGFTNNTIILEGDTPEFGSLRVKINLVRHADGREISREFRVVTELLDAPIFAEVMYPDIKYTIEPNLPMLSNIVSLTKLVNAEGRIIHVSESNLPFTFTPSNSDIDKEYFIERYINEKLIGSRYKIVVRDYPLPEIYRIARMERNKVRIFTNSYGIWQGSENYIKSIEITEGNAVYREIIGAQKVIKDKQIITQQVFEISPKDESKPFNFKIRAVAQNNKRSKIVSYPEN